MKLALILSLVANVALGLLLILSRGDGAPSNAANKSAAYCDVLKKDLDFFIEGLSKGNDPFYTPIVAQSIGSLLPSCFPEHAAMIQTTMAELRKALLHLVVQNASPEQKRQAHDSALRLFNSLRELYGSR